MQLENFTIRKNDFKKEGSNQPDYTISAKIGEEWKNVGGCWIKEDKNKKKYFSCKVTPPEPKEERKEVDWPTDEEREAAKNIPF